MNNFTQFVTLLATMSVAVERAVEIVKGLIPFLAGTDPAKENLRHAALQGIAVLFGGITAYFAKDQVTGPAQMILQLHYGAGYLIFGLLTAGGSAFWNHILDIIGALKTQQENKATGISPVAAPVPAPAAAGAVAGKTN